jgi:hypothetical protein
VNDKPIIKNIPNLVVHHNIPYRFNLTYYIEDVETPRDELIINAQDKYGNQYVRIEGKEIVFEYPDTLKGETILTTITVSDGEDITEAIISVKISDDWPPILMKELPDIVIYEGTTLYDRFNLDDYFMDPDGDDLYYSYSESHVIIFIKGNNTVDIISRDEWTGEEIVIIRARDPYGGIVEDVIKITVLPINDPPVIAELPDIMVHFDMDYYFDMSYYISDIDNSPIELSISTSDPEHIRISSDNHFAIILNYPKSMLGITTNVVITVFDGLLKATQNISVLVIPEYPPELIKKLPSISFNEDEMLVNYLDLDNHFLDYDNDSLYYTSGNVKIEISIDEHHRVTFSAVDNWSGTEKVIFRATDPIGALVEAPTLITVVPVNDPPVLAPIEKIIINETEIFELDLTEYIQDIDTNLSYLNIVVEDPNVMVSGTSLVIFGSVELPDEVNIYINDGELTTTGKLEIQVITEKDPSGPDESTIKMFSVILVLIIIAILITIMYVMRREQKFKIEEIFLIHNSGKLISHTFFKTHSRFDDEIFSGMFTAIQQFIEDSFSNELPDTRTKLGMQKIEQEPEEEPSFKLNEFKVGDNQVIIEHGKYIFMAVVYTGRGARALHRVINHTISAVEKKFGKHLEYWTGDMKPLSDLPGFLEGQLPRFKPEMEKEKAEKNKAEKLKAEQMNAEKLKAELLNKEKIKAEKLNAEKLKAKQFNIKKVKGDRLRGNRSRKGKVKHKRSQVIHKPDMPIRPLTRNKLYRIKKV